MAKLPALVSALADIDGRERKTIDYVARTIREREYITTDKRGSGAADMTVRESVNLLIAVNGTDVPKKSPVAIDRFRSLVQLVNVRDLAIQIDRVNQSSTGIQFLANANTFGEALERMIESVPDLNREFLERVLSIAIRDKIPESIAIRSVRDLIANRVLGPEVTFRDHSAKIEFFLPNIIPTSQSGYDGEGVRESVLTINYRPDKARGPAFYDLSRDRIANPPDRSISIGYATIVQIHNALFPSVEQTSGEE